MRQGFRNDAIIGAQLMRERQRRLRRRISSKLVECHAAHFQRFEKIRTLAHCHLRVSSGPRIISHSIIGVAQIVVDLRGLRVKRQRLLKGFQGMPVIGKLAEESSNGDQLINIGRLQDGAATLPRGFALPPLKLLAAGCKVLLALEVVLMQALRFLELSFRLFRFAELEIGLAQKVSGSKIARAKGDFALEKEDRFLGFPFLQKSRAKIIPLIPQRLRSLQRFKLSDGFIDAPVLQIEPSEIIGHPALAVTRGCQSHELSPGVIKFLFIEICDRQMVAGIQEIGVGAQGKAEFFGGVREPLQVKELETGSEMSHCLLGRRSLSD